MRKNQATLSPINQIRISLKSWYLYNKKHMTAAFELKISKSVTLQHVSTLASLRNETQKVEVVVTRRFIRQLLKVSFKFAWYISLMFC